MMKRLDYGSGKILLPWAYESGLAQPRTSHAWKHEGLKLGRTGEIR